MAGPRQRHAGHAANASGPMGAPLRAQPLRPNCVSIELMALQLLLLKWKQVVCVAPEEAEASGVVWPTGQSV